PELVESELNARQHEALVAVGDHDGRQAGRLDERDRWRAGGDPVERDRVVEREPAAARAAELDEMRATADIVAEVRDQAADVGALAARDRDAKPRRLEREQLEAIDAHAARPTLDVLAGARALVEPDAALLDRRVHRGQLVVLAGACREGRDQLVARDRD